MSLFISEIFYSIQGESIFSGRPCSFVRLSGCNLRCSYCDTRFAYEHGAEMSISEILSRVSQIQCRLVEITGGEPLLQQETPELINNLVENGYEVMLETNGSLNIGIVDKRCVKIMDIKCPSSNESDKNDLSNLRRLNKIDQVKFVIGTREDFEFMKNILKTHSLDLPDGHILLSPIPDRLPASTLAEWILDEHLNVRLQLQLHKLLWPDRERGI